MMDLDRSWMAAIPWTGCQGNGPDAVSPTAT